MGFFTNAYNIFYISIVSKLLGRLYYAITGVALIGTLIGHLFFGWIDDKLGRKKAYNISLTLTIICAICSGLSFDASKETVVKTLCFFRFWLGFGIGGDYPISAVIMSKYSNKKTRGAFIAALYAMQDDPVISTQPEANYLWRIVLMLGV
uniref:Major facilitator superfamily (MFS) profile domain-containing protein n=1 Tax=Quercus lobata TaxID=97700 RepID=A0A7N2LIF5_QUELO